MCDSHRVTPEVCLACLSAPDDEQWPMLVALLKPGKSGGHGHT